MRTTCLISFAVLFMMAGQAFGYWWWPPSNVEIIPQNPTSCDVVVIRLSGTWPDISIPYDSAVSVVDSNIYFDVTWNVTGGHPVIISWKRTRSVGPLSPGMYNIYTRLVGFPYIPEEYTWMAEFIVTYESHVDTVYYVDAVRGDDNNDGLSQETAFATIQKGVDSAKSGDTIIVAQGVYTGVGNYNIDFYCKAITVRSTDPKDPAVVAATVVDCQGYSHKGFYFCSNEGPNSVLSGLTITKGFHGIHCCDYSGPTISNCTITNNRASDYAAEIWCHNSSPTISNCTISGNSSEYGPGIYACYNSNLTITNCIIVGNHADHGGGIYCEAASSPTITNCTISGNSATFRGGGIYVRDNSNPTITNCVISGNMAKNYCGGGIFSFDSEVLIANCTFFANSSPNGNALACDSWYQPYPSNIQVFNCILWDGGNEIWNNDASVITITYSDVLDGWPGEGNIEDDPCFADVNNDDYHLKSQAGRWEPNSQSWIQDDVTSPCIDAGNIHSPIGQEPFPNGGIINMGAFGGTIQASKSYFGEPVCEVIVAGDINGDCKVNFLDFRLMTLHWLRDENR